MITDRRRLERLQQKTKVDGTCHLYTGTHNRTGYGVVKYRGKRIGAHRLMWILCHGDPGTKFVCHSCDVPACINVAHLWLGTHDENMADKVQKERQAKGDKSPRRLRADSYPVGERHYRAKLRAKDVKRIRTVYAQGHISLRALAAHYGVDTAAIHAVVQRRSWKSVL